MGPRVALLATVVFVAACSSILGIEELPPRPQPAESEACRACVVDSCAAARDACLADDACRALYQCAAPCGDAPEGGPRCRYACERAADTTARGALWSALDRCRRGDCTDECFGYRGFGQLADKACGCSDEICVPFLKQCVRSGDCERRLACIGHRPAPADPDDALGCTYEERGGQDELALVRLCWQGAACDPSCLVSGGRLMSCASKYQWARPTEESVSFTLMVIDRQARPLENARVEVCEAGDCDACTMPLDARTTDAAGLVELKLATFNHGFRGCFQIRAPGKLPTLWYMGRPLPRTEWLQRALVVSAEEHALMLDAVGARPDPTRGQVMVAARDCVVTPASGVTFDPPTDPNAIPIYFLSGESSRAGPTDDTGQYGIGNLPPGLHTVVMRDKSGAELGRSTIRVRAGWATGVYVFPAAIASP